MGKTMTDPDPIERTVPPIDVQETVRGLVALLRTPFMHLNGMTREEAMERVLIDFIAREKAETERGKRRARLWGIVQGATAVLALVTTVITLAPQAAKFISAALGGLQ